MDKHPLHTFDQSAANRTRQAAELAATVARDLEQSIGLGWWEQFQARSGELTKAVAGLAHSIDVVMELSAGRYLAFACKASRSYGQEGRYHALPKNPSLLSGGAAEHASLEIAYRVVRSLMEREQIALARKTLDALPVGRLDDPMINTLCKMLAVPTTKTSQKRDIDRVQDYGWIRDHAQDYRGQWVALHNGALLGAAASLRELLNRVNPLKLEHRPLFHQIPS